MNFALRTLAAVVIFAPGAVGAARGDVVYSNLGANDSYSSTTSWALRSMALGDLTNQDLGMGFTVVGGDYYLTSIEVPLRGRPTAGQDELVFRIMSNAPIGGRPDQVLETFTVIADTTRSNGLATGIAAGTLILREGLTYWLTTDVSASTYHSSLATGLGGWMWTDPAVVGPFVVSFDQRGTWIDAAGLTQAAFRVNGRSTTAVPEPAGLMLGCVAAIGGLLVVSRRSGPMLSLGLRSQAAASPKILNRFAVNRCRSTVLVASLIVLGFAPVARSEMLTYTLSMHANGTVGAVAFNDALMTFRVTADPLQVVAIGAGGYSLDAGPMSLAIEGVGVGEFADVSYLEVWESGGLANLLFGVGPGGSVGGAGVFQSPELAGYDLTTEMAPTLGLPFWAIVPPYSTTLGLLSFLPSRGETTFTAAAAVPEPTALASAFVALTCLGLAARRPRR